MSFAGHWNITLHAPSGIQQLELSVHLHGNTMTGTVKTATGETVAIENGHAHNDEASWHLPIKRPLPMMLECSATLHGDTLKGTAKLPMLGTAAFEGVRAA